MLALTISIQSYRGAPPNALAFALGRTLGLSFAENVALFPMKPLMLEFVRLLTALGLKSSAPVDVTMGTPLLERTLAFSPLFRLNHGLFFFWSATTSLLWRTSWDAVMVGGEAGGGGGCWSIGSLSEGPSTDASLEAVEASPPSPTGELARCFPRPSSKLPRRLDCFLLNIDRSLTPMLLL